MLFSKPQIIALFAVCCIFAIICGCGRGSEVSEDRELFISGTLGLPDDSMQTDAPVMVAVTRTMDPDTLRTRPDQAIIAYVAASKQAADFRVDLTDTEARAGDAVFVFAFFDRNYNGGVPFPDSGDEIGFYEEEGQLDPALTLRAGGNTGLQIDINRRVYDYEAAISGQILGDASGPVTLVAYAGPVTSSDFTSLEYSQVMGVITMDKPDRPADYRVDILPYGQDVPIEDLQVFAILDQNQSQSVDGGDRIGFFSQGDNFSTPITVPAGRVGDIDLEFKFDVPEPSGYDISLTGQVPDLAAHDADRPLYISVFDAQSPDNVLEDPYTGLKYFYQVPPDVYNYTIDLPKTDLCPGDEVMVVALRDNDFTGGFPQLSSGDKLGLVQNPGDYRMTMELTHGVNPIPPSGYEFPLNKNVYEYEASLSYSVNLSTAGDYGAESRLIVLAVHVNGVNDLSSFNIDINYLLAADILPARDYDSRELPVLTAIYEGLEIYEDAEPPDPLIESVGTFSERTAYLVAVLDKDDNGQLDGNDEVGYYGGLLLPRTISRITREANQGPYEIGHFSEP